MTDLVKNLKLIGVLLLFIFSMLVPMAFPTQSTFWQLLVVIELTLSTILFILIVPTRDELVSWWEKRKKRKEAEKEAEIGLYLASEEPPSGLTNGAL